MSCAWLAGLWPYCGEGEGALGISMFERALLGCRASTWGAVVHSNEGKLSHFSSRSYKKKNNAKKNLKALLTCEVEIRGLCKGTL